MTQFSYVSDVDEIAAIYGVPSQAAILKVAHEMTPEYRQWISQSQFCVLSTVGPEGTDGSPRGDEGPVVTELDPQTLLMPDWRGNNRMDSLRNIVRDGRVSLMFMVPGSKNVIRVNGLARVSTDPALLGRFTRKEGQPRSVIVIKIAEVYSQCARAILRAGLWSGDDRTADLPTMGEILAAQEAGFDGASYDATWAARAAQTMW